jgi:hypothetical protein
MQIWVTFVDILLRYLGNLRNMHVCLLASWGLRLIGGMKAISLQGLRQDYRLK